MRYQHGGGDCTIGLPQGYDFANHIGVRDEAKRHERDGERRFVVVGGIQLVNVQYKCRDFKREAEKNQIGLMVVL